MGWCLMSDCRYLLTLDTALSKYADSLCWVVRQGKKLRSLPLSSVCSVSEDTVKMCGSSLSYIIGCEKIQEHIKVGKLKITVSK